MITFLFQKKFSILLSTFMVSLAYGSQGSNTTSYKSQKGQDKYLNENFFKNKQGGFFVEFGAYDGVYLSNSYFFEKELNWNGICAEPIPEIYKKLRANRKCICVEGAVYNHSGFEEFKHFSGGPDPAFASEMYSGIVSKLHPKHVAKVEHHKKGRYGRTETIYKVKTYLLNDLLKEYGISYVDYLSIDTEGGEYEILQSIDFEKYYIYIIGVENNYNDTPIRKFMAESGYKFVTRLGKDDIYVNTRTYEKNLSKSVL